jgi:hypothetical protein
MSLSSVLPSGDFHAEKWYYAVLSTLSGITTMLFILGSPWVVWRGSRLAQNACAWVAASAFVLNSHWYVLFSSDRKDLRLGYFIWWLSFGVLAIGLFDFSRLRDWECGPAESNVITRA